MVDVDSGTAARVGNNAHMCKVFSQGEGRQKKATRRQSADFASLYSILDFANPGEDRVSVLVVDVEGARLQV